MGREVIFDLTLTTFEVIRLSDLNLNLYRSTAMINARQLEMNYYSQYKCVELNATRQNDCNMLFIVLIYL